MFNRLRTYLKVRKAKKEAYINEMRVLCSNVKNYSYVKFKNQLEVYVENGGIPIDIFSVGYTVHNESNYGPYYKKGDVFIYRDDKSEKVEAVFLILDKFLVYESCTLTTGGVGWKDYKLNLLKITDVEHLETIKNKIKVMLPPKSPCFDHWSYVNNHQKARMLRDIEEYILAF